MKNTIRFIKITTLYTEAEMDAIVHAMSDAEAEAIVKLYAKFNIVEFVNELGYQCMFVAIHENYITELLETYTKYSVSFTYEDMTKEALYGMFDITKVGISDGSVSIHDTICSLKDLLENFIESNLEPDMVLDKITELGINSLSEKDKRVLESI